MLSMNQNNYKFKTKYIMTSLYVVGCSSAPQWSGHLGTIRGGRQRCPRTCTAKCSK